MTDADAMITPLVRASYIGHLVIERRESGAYERFEVLCDVATSCLDRRIPLHLNSPGGSVFGELLLTRGCDGVIGGLFPNAEDLGVPEDHLRYMFYFGVALHDVERIVRELEGEPPRVW